MNNTEIKLRNVLKMNALFSMLSVGFLLTIPQQIAKLMNIAHENVLFYLGLIIIFFICLVVYTAYSKKLNRSLVVSIIVQDGLWVMASIFLIVWKPWSISWIGNMIIGIVAGVVALFALFQYKHLKRL